MILVDDRQHLCKTKSVRLIFDRLCKSRFSSDTQQLAFQSAPIPRLNTLSPFGGAFCFFLIFSSGLCIIESLVYGAVLIALDVYTDKKVTGSILYDAVITVIIFSAINITVCEHRVRSCRRYQARLDAEEVDDTK